MEIAFSIVLIVFGIILLMELVVLNELTRDIRNIKYCLERYIYKERKKWRLTETE